MVHVHPEQHGMFSDVRHARLRGLGFWSIVGSACCTPRLDGEAWRRVWSMVLWLRAGARADRIREWMCGNMRMEALPLALRCPCPAVWLSSVVSSNEAMRDERN
eukprot:417460-Alexandrium_andersonii.AAC.1